MSSPIQGDIVLALDRNNAVHPAIVMDVIGSTLTVAVWFDAGDPNGPTGSQFIHDTLTGLTEVADVASLTSGTWCRREVCG